MAITKIADLGDTIPTVIEQARFTEQVKAIMRGLCWNIKKPKGSTINVPYFGEITANHLTEGVDMITAETMQDTNVQITMAEAGLKIILTESLIEDDQEDLKRAAGRLMGDAYGKLVDQDLLSQIDDAATSSAGSASPLTMGTIAAGRATLLGNVGSSGGPAPTPYVCVIHPNHELDIVDVLTPILPVYPTAASTSGFQAMGTPFTDEILRNYSIGRLFGMPILVDGNIAMTASAAKGGIFASGEGGSIIFGLAREPNVRPEIDASLRAVELNYVGRYGYGEYLAGWIYEIFADAAAPS